MATKIRRCLYIGLGGTGMASLMYTKRMFIETYGEVPPMIGFLGIDTDGGVYNRELQSKYGLVRIEPNEQMPIRFNDAAPIYKAQEQRFAWVPRENVIDIANYPHSPTSIRSSGRFALTVNYERVVEQVKIKINEITNARIADNSKYELLSMANVEIHMVFSIAGGTGSGTFINMAYLLKDIMPQCKVMGYAVLPDIFETMNSGLATCPFKANGYGAIMDLDWFMHRNIGQDAFTLQYIKHDCQAHERPFNSIVFINNQNENNDTYDNVDQLAEMISLGLVTAAGELSVAAKSVNDNLEKIISDGNMDIDSKIAWVAGMGASEIIFRGSDLGRIYALKSSNYIIENMLNTCVDTNVIVNNWIDQMRITHYSSPNDEVIDFILPRRPQYEMSTINDAQNAQAEVNGYVDTQIPKDDALQKRLQELKDRVEPEFRKLLIDNINTECGVGTAEKILQGLTAQFDVMLNEMETERTQHQAAEKRNEQAVIAMVNDLAEYNSKFFKVKGKMDSKTQDVMAAAVNLAISKREILRRNKAIEFFTFMKSLILNEEQELNSIHKKLEGVYRDNQAKLAAVQNRVNGDEQQLFQIDLAQKYVGSIPINNQEVNFTDLFNSMPEGEKFHGIGKMSNNEVSDILLAYTMGLNGTKKWTGMSLNDVLKQMDENDFDTLVKQALRKSLPLFTYDTHGYIPQTAPTDIIYIGVPSKNCRINKNEIMKHIPGGANVDAAVIGMNDRIILYRQLGVVPAFTIAPLSSYQQKYEEGEGRRNYHIDANLQRLMQQEQFSLWPASAPPVREE